ncbi:hypothetical protein SPBRAN_149 [uncultured Candidatus Thioglobus sp.]|nr:hypothetical protein SPBRAN_149 [uncultured Candidatus Thioglobus sp.]
MSNPILNLKSKIIPTTTFEHIFYRDIYIYLLRDIMRPLHKYE